MIIKIPGQDNRFTQTNTGEVSGNIWASWNLDLTSNPGRIRVSPQTQVVMTNVNSTLIAVEDSDFDLVNSFVMSDADGTMRIWAVATNYLWNTSGTSALTGWAQDAKTSTPTTTDANSDCVEFNDELIVSLPTTLSRCNSAGSWDTSWNSVSLTTGIPHPLCTSFNNLLLIGNGNVIISVDTSDTVDATRITLPVEYEVQWIRSSNSMVFIGTRNKKSERAKIFTFDGHSENFNDDYKINGTRSISGVIKDEICYTMNEVGELLAFNGGAFVQVAVFPNFDLKLNFSGSLNARRCMAVQDDDIYILLNSSLTGSVGYGLENMRAGIWRYNPSIGLHHTISLTKTAGTDIPDYGSPYISNAGALYPLQRVTGSFLIGAGMRANTADSPSYYALVLRELETETTAKIGYFITPQIPTKEVEENWQKAYLLIKKFLNSTDKIVVKYRTDEETLVETPALCVWASTTSFTSTDTQFSTVAVGDEVEILEGEGSGLSTHITAISFSTPTYTVTIEDTVTDASGSIRAVVWNWIKVGTAVDTQGLRNFELPLAVNSSHIQFKVVMFFKGKNQVERLIIKSDKHQPIK